MQNCHECGFQFYLLSQRFYCCDSSKPVCSVCHRKICQECKKPRTHQIVIPRCDKCYSRLYESDLLLENQCDRYYCSKCLSKIFKQAYQQVTIQKIYDQSDTDIFVQLYCKHEFPFSQLVKFFHHFCLCCGRQYDSTLDYSLNDGVKMCFLCYRYFAQTFQSLFIHCQMCQNIIQNSNKASILENTDVAICQKCTVQSQIQEKNISASRKKLPSKLQVDKEDQFLVKKFENVAQKQDKKSDNKEQVSTKKSPLTKLLSKPSISELKKKEQKRSINNNSTSRSVTSRFSNVFEEVDEQWLKSLGLPQNIKIKKHLSNQTYVEQYNIQIPQNNEKDYVRCKKCEIKILLSQAYDLYKKSQKMDGKSSLIDFSCLRTLSSFSQQNNYYLCRVCYSKSSQRQKNSLSLSGSKSRIELTSSNRPSKLEEPSQNMDYLKVGKSSRRQNRSPSPSPNDKQYSLTGSRVQGGSKSSIEMMKESLLGKSPVQENKPVQKRYTRPLIHPVSTQSRHTINSHSQKFMKCELCRDYKKSLIATLNQGYLCDECYYSKNPNYSSFFKR